ncbi:hypothetical protein NQ317_013939 [Molorchus minor]|uniref:Uncharacterized protein n=1 Tax=Molorchus minor TaxID=1323400 RepID=A0ABQ9K6H9_9CUCU|nr:hypothetical protein NQ317_013939 [Molorchus minor]
MFKTNNKDHKNKTSNYLTIGTYLPKCLRVKVVILDNCITKKKQRNTLVIIYLKNKSNGSNLPWQIYRIQRSYIKISGCQFLTVLPMREAKRGEYRSRINNTGTILTSLGLS